MLNLKIMYLTALATIITSCQTTNTIDPNIQKLESFVTVPDGRKLQEYDRYYFYNGSTINGIYLKTSHKEGTIYKVTDKSQIDLFMDGGCDMVHVEADVSDFSKIDIFCNGES